MPPVRVDRELPFKLSMTVDFFGDGGRGLYTPQTLDLMMREARRLGVTRVYWQYLGDLEQDRYGAGTNMLRTPWAKYGPLTLAAIGEPLEAAVRAAHGRGLEIFGVLKPYHTGMSATYPEGSPDSDPATPMRRIGGSLQCFNPFMERFPHTRIQRRPVKGPPNLRDVPIRRIRLIKRDDSPTRIRARHLEIWSSPDNYRYGCRQVDFQLEETVEPSLQENRDYYGQIVTKKGDPVRVLSLTGLDLRDRYLVVATNFRGGSTDFENTALGMIQVFGPDPEALPIVLATRDATWVRPRDFRTYGLEFDSGYGTRLLHLDGVWGPAAEGSTPKESQTRSWHEHRAELGRGSGGGFIAFARGKNEYLPVAPCEFYPEVQRLWRWRVKRMLEKGVDGVVLRVSAHGTLTDEPYEYGFNPPVVEAYRERHGVDIRREEFDPDLLGALRGEAYTRFVRQASAMTRRAGKLFQLQVHTEAFRPDPVFGQLMGFPANIQFAWRQWLEEGLADAVTLRSSWYEAAEDPLDGSPPWRSRLSNVLADPVVGEVLEVAKDLELPVYLNRYVARAVPIREYADDLERIWRDRRFAGFDLYEFFHLTRATPDGSRLVPVQDRMRYIRRKARELGLAGN